MYCPHNLVRFIQEWGFFIFYKQTGVGFVMAQTVPVFLCLDFSSNPPGLRCPVFAARHGGRLQKADRVPLALGRFSRRGAVPACENRSAAPNTAPCFVRRTRSLCLPLLRFGCFCRRQRLSCAARRPQMFPRGCAAGPLALSRFLRRGAVPACKNRSAAPASPRCFCRRQRSAQLPHTGALGL